MFRCKVEKSWQKMAKVGKVIRSCQNLSEVAKCCQMLPNLKFREDDGFIISARFIISEMKLFNNQPILATILRAGIPLHQGLLNYFDNSPSAFISASRNHIDEKKIDVKIEYLASPKIDNQIIVLSDPMLASGSSMLLALNTLLDIGTPSFVHIVSSIASKEGVDYLKKNIKFRHCKLWLGAVDNQLNDKSYIVPGLGDAGDLAFGIKY